MLSLFYVILADSLNITKISTTSRFIRFIPLYVVVISTFSIFLYLLPGLCDPEINQTKRLPFLMLNYFILAILGILYFSINGFNIIQQANGFILFFPLIFNLLMHIITIVTDQYDHKTELFVTCSILVEILIFSMEWDESIIIRFSIALITWTYLYYKFVLQRRFSRQNSGNGSGSQQL